jgi:type I restriction enzyme S subunit
MAVNKMKLGSLLDRVERRNVNLEYGVDEVRGVLNTKGFMPTRANIDGRSLGRFLIIKPGEFAFNRRTTRNGERLGLGFNNTVQDYIVTEDYVAFSVKNEEALLSEYLYIFFQRDEFDRLVRYSSWGSATEFFNWGDMCDIEIELPSIPVQQKYVDVYNALVQNQKGYDFELENLKLTCDAYIEKLRKETPLQTIGEYIEQLEERNIGLKYGKKDVKGMTITKEIIPTKANISETTFENYIIVGSQQFVYNPRTHGKKIGLGFNNTDTSFIITWNNIAFGIKEQAKDLILPEYLFLFFKRDEWDRWACFNSWGSSTEVFSWDDLCETKIPIPDVPIQQSIVSIYHAYNKRKELVDKLKAQITDICPILIKGAMGEAQDE